MISEGRAGPGGRTGILVGDKLAAELKLRPGSPLQVKKRRFTVTGIYHSGVFFEDTGAILDLDTAQRLEHRGERRDDRRGAARARTSGTPPPSASLKRALPGTQILGTADEAERAGANGQLVRKRRHDHRRAGADRRRARGHEHDGDGGPRAPARARAAQRRRLAARCASRSSCSPRAWR